MHIKKFDGTDEVKPYDAAEMQRALEDATVASVDVVKPGGVITRSNGRRYRLNALGQWERIDE